MRPDRGSVQVQEGALIYAGAHHLGFTLLLVSAQCAVVAWGAPWRAPCPCGSVPAVVGDAALVGAA